MLKYKVAILNVLRNYRRSLITLAAIVLGCASLILFGGFVASMYEGMRENLDPFPVRTYSDLCKRFSSVLLMLNQKNI